MKKFRDIYLKMVNFPEIQNKLKVKVGKYIFDKNSNDVYIISEIQKKCIIGINDFNNYKIIDNYFIIPIQEDFQDLLKTNCPCNMDWLHLLKEIDKFSNLCEIYYGDNEIIFYTNIDDKNYSLENGIKLRNERNEKWINPVLTWDEFWLGLYMYKTYKLFWNNKWE